MYYEEKWFCGELWFRSSPDGEWNPCSSAMLNSRILELMDELQSDL